MILAFVFTILLTLSYHQQALTSAPLPMRVKSIELLTLEQLQRRFRECKISNESKKIQKVFKADRYQFVLETPKKCLPNIEMPNIAHVGFYGGSKKLNLCVKAQPKEQYEQKLRTFFVSWSLKDGACEIYSADSQKWRAKVKDERDIITKIDNDDLSAEVISNTLDNSKGVIQHLVRVTVSKAYIMELLAEKQPLFGEDIDYWQAFLSSCCCCSRTKKVKGV